MISRQSLQFMRFPGRAREPESFAALPELGGPMSAGIIHESETRLRNVQSWHVLRLSCPKHRAKCSTTRKLVLIGQH